MWANIGPQPCRGKEGKEGGGSDPEWGMVSRVLERTAAGHSLELPVWCGDVAAQQPPRSRSRKCVATFLGFIFFLLVSKKRAGGNGFPQSMPRMTQPCLLHELRGRGAVKTGRQDHSWHRMQNVGTAMRTCNGTCSVPGQNVCSCRVFLDQQHPVGQKLRVASALLVFHPCPGSL